MILLEFNKVMKRFRRNMVLKGISFRIKEGEIFGLVGRSGCGKSTLLRIIMGMMRPNSGQILFEGGMVWSKLRYLRKNTGFAPQGNTLFNELSIYENAMFFGKLYGVDKDVLKKRFDELVSLLGLNGFEKYFVSLLSGGMKKRANLLVSLIHGPKLLILDEPTVGLDSILRGSLWKYIKKINKEGTTILVTSHLLNEIEENCDRVAIIKDGAIETIVTIQEYKKVYGNKNLSEIFKEVMK